MAKNKNKKLKWKYLRTVSMHVADGGKYSIESYQQSRSYCLMIKFNEYNIVYLPLPKVSIAKKVAQLIHNG